jgi:hypothetical protein
MRFKRIPVGFVVPAHPVAASRPPSGADWVHEIKHDGRLSDMVNLSRAKDAAGIMALGILNRPRAIALPTAEASVTSEFGTQKDPAAVLVPDAPKLAPDAAPCTMSDTSPVSQDNPQSPPPQAGEGEQHSRGWGVGPWGRETWGDGAPLRATGAASTASTPDRTDPISGQVYPGTPGAQRNSRHQHTSPARFDVTSPLSP